MAKFNINKETIGKAMWSVLTGITLAGVIRLIYTKTRYYKRASEVMEKSNTMIDKYEKFLDKELND